MPQEQDPAKWDQVQGEDGKTYSVPKGTPPDKVDKYLMGEFGTRPRRPLTQQPSSQPQTAQPQPSAPAGAAGPSGIQQVVPDPLHPWRTGPQVTYPTQPGAPVEPGSRPPGPPPSTPSQVPQTQQQAPGAPPGVPSPAPAMPQAPPQAPPGLAVASAGGGAKLWDQFPKSEFLADVIMKQEGQAANSRAIRNNNPGNIKYYDGLKGAVGPDDKGFAIFQEMQDGHDALVEMLDRFREKYPDLTIEQFIKGGGGYRGYANDSSPMEQANYIRALGGLPQAPQGGGAATVPSTAARPPAAPVSQATNQAVVSRPATAQQGLGQAMAGGVPSSFTGQGGMWGHLGGLGIQAVEGVAKAGGEFLADLGESVGKGIYGEDEYLDKDRKSRQAIKQVLQPANDAQRTGMYMGRAGILLSPLAVEKTPAFMGWLMQSPFSGMVSRYGKNASLIAKSAYNIASGGVTEVGTGGNAATGVGINATWSGLMALLTKGGPTAIRKLFGVKGETAEERNLAGDIMMKMKGTFSRQGFLDKASELLTQTQAEVDSMAAKASRRSAGLKWTQTPRYAKVPIHQLFDQVEKDAAAAGPAYAKKYEGLLEDMERESQSVSKGSQLAVRMRLQGMKQKMAVLDAGINGTGGQTKLKGAALQTAQIAKQQLQQKVNEINRSLRNVDMDISPAKLNKLRRMVGGQVEWGNQYAQDAFQSTARSLHDKFEGLLEMTAHDPAAMGQKLLEERALRTIQDGTRRTLLSGQARLAARVGSYLGGGKLGLAGSLVGRGGAVGAIRAGASPFGRQAGEAASSLFLSNITRPIVTTEEQKRREQRARESKWQMSITPTGKTTPFGVE